MIPSGVVQCLTTLAENERLPTDSYVSVTQAALARITDTLKSVRKAAMLLMESLLQRNPFGRFIDLVKAEQERNKLLEDIEHALPSAAAAPGDEGHARGETSVINANSFLTHMFQQCH